MQQHVVAIIPARGGSTGIPRKNLKTVGGKPLVVHAVEHARDAETVGLAVVTSDDEEIRSVAAGAGALVLGRPDEFAHDRTWQEVDRLLVWVVGELEARKIPVDVVVLLYPTAPLRRPEFVDQAVRLVTEGGCDSALSLYRDMRYLWEVVDGSPRPTNYLPCERMPRQMEGWNQWAENKAVYAVRRELLVRTGCRIGGRVGYVEMPKWMSIDVDTPQDLELAEYIYRARVEGK
ncbi:MAG: hypothetical protein AB7D57_03220 [Desulfovibrionaceae bacterium]